MLVLSFSVVFDVVVAVVDTVGVLVDDRGSCVVDEVVVCSALRHDYFSCLCYPCCWWFSVHFAVQFA